MSRLDRRSSKNRTRYEEQESLDGHRRRSGHSPRRLDVFRRQKRTKGRVFYCQGRKAEHQHVDYCYGHHRARHFRHRRYAGVRYRVETLCRLQLHREERSDYCRTRQDQPHQRVEPCQGRPVECAEHAELRDRQLQPLQDAVRQGSHLGQRLRECPPVVRQGSADSTFES